MSYHTLSIRLSTDGFSFSIYNPTQDATVSLHEKEVNPLLSLTANLKQAFRELDFLSDTYRKINIMIADKRFTLVPLELFDDDQAEIMFNHNHTRRENEIVQYNVLKKSNAVVLFGIDKSAHQLLCEQFQSPKFYSQSSTLIEYFSVKSKLGNNKKMYASVRSNAIDLYCFEHGHLILANSYECKETTDRIYYLLYIWKQLNFSQERDELHLTGLLTDKENLMTELRKFILKVFIMIPETNIDMQAIQICE